MDIPRDIKLWYWNIKYLNYKILIILRNLSTRINIKKITLNKIYGNYQKRDQIYLLLKSFIF